MSSCDKIKWAIYFVDTSRENLSLTIISIGVMLFTTAIHWEEFLIGFILTGFLERGWTTLTGFTLYPQAQMRLGVKVNDRPIGYFLGKPAVISV